MQITEKKVEKFIRQKNLMPPDGKILLAVSGGADSVAMLCILDKLFHDRLHIAHINHQLRGSDSLNDEYFVQQLAAKFKLPLATKLVDVIAFAKTEKLSIETAARQLRTDALIQIAEKYNCTAIATAHHKNDNAETLIHRILRGTGCKGLAGIKSKTIIDGKTYIRPLLCLSKDEIEKYLTSKNISWQNDYTNTDTRFTRNRIRHKLLPELIKETPDIIEILNSLAEKCEKLNDKIEKLCRTAAKECFIANDEKQITVDSQKFVQLPQPVQVELLQTALTQIGCGLRNYTLEHYKKMCQFIRTAQTGKTLAMPEKVSIAKGYAKVFIAKTKLKTNTLGAVPLNLPGKTIFANYTIKTEILDRIDTSKIKEKNKYTEFFDFTKIKQPLLVRERQKGDKFRPFGQKCLKKVGKFLTSAKIDAEQKNRTIIICHNNTILWVAPVRRSNEAIIDSLTPQILKITLLTH